MQCLLPALLKADRQVSLQVHGGTDVRWAPTIDYFRYVFLPALCCFGAKTSLEVCSRGYYPKGQGEVSLQVDPAELKAAHFGKHEKGTVCGISHCSNLPDHVAQRQAKSAMQILKSSGFEAQVDLQVLHLPSTCSGITLWSGWKGASSLGERGLPAENVGTKAARELIIELKSDAVVDMYLADQLIPYLALAGGSYTAGEITLHTKTNIWTARHFLDAKIEIRDDRPFEIVSTIKK
jgi:RNA 3'-terminal phosphate cyclase (ATP)